MPLFAPILAVALIIFSVVNNTMPEKFSSPAELAKWSKCEPQAIRDWLGERYPWTDGLRNEGYIGAEACLRRGYGDCKCFMQITAATLDLCPGYKPHAACLKGAVPGTNHCVTYFEAPDGRRGFFNNGLQVELYPPDYPWNKMLPDIYGKWTTP